MIFSPMVINLQAFKVNVLDNSSVLSIGPNQQLDVFVSYKRNQGLGESNGDFSPSITPFSWIVDSDVNDSNSVKNSVI
ncbi:hypothetical protein IUJ58_25310 [Priestia aryabhattai]|uniref:hypothetical protein n=1 Tax=Priestia aryabhattai TaxID=412384 RepID=UPI001C0C3055|nr:hypothetical protein [Priestia aryabhattai]MBU3569115.1 hypothetical protein [Priestia aryabhattai]WDL87222.1 hypothetical protein IUJ58_25310 [Priestia aryabhattai]